MNNLPFFSVIIPTYNRATKLKEAVQSVCDQSFKNFELIIVDDGSTDNTKQVIESFRDERIKYIYQNNQERSAARNNGIRNAKGTFICFLDSDDLYLPQHLESLWKSIAGKENKLAVFSTGMLRINDQEIAFGHPMPYTNNVSPVLYVWKHFLFANTVCAHYKVFETHLFDERFRIWEDTHLWLRLLSIFPFHQIPEYTVIQKQHRGSTVESMFRKIKVSEIEQYIKAIDDIFENYYDLVRSSLTIQDRDDYIERKYMMFYSTAISNKQYDVADYISRARNRRLKNNLKFAYRLLLTKFYRYLLR